MLPKLALSLAALGDLLLVDPSPHTYDSIQAAIDAAPPGSTILVRGGTYQEQLLLGSKSLSILAVDGAELWGELRVAGSTFQEEILIDGLRVVGSFSAVRIEACAGTVWLEDVHAEPTSAPGGLGLALSVELSDDVLISGGHFSGRDGPAGDGVQAARFADSVVNLFDCDLLSIAPSGASTVASAPGLEVIGSIVFASYARFRGADGAAAIEDGEGNCQSAAPGAAGVVAGDGAFIATELTLIEPVAEGGSGGASAGDCPAAPDGALFQITPSTKVGLDSPTLPQRLHQTNGLVEAGEELFLWFAGTPGEALVGIVGITPQPAFEPQFGGVFGTFDTAFVQLLGLIGPTGQFSLGLPVEPPLGAPASELYSQGLFFSVEDGFVLSTPRATTILAQPD